MNFDHHPCFGNQARHRFGRIHLPVAPRCNVQCHYCHREYDCVNESRPGVTSEVLTPPQALAYLEQVMAQRTDITVTGIAGPGDPFANAAETLETLQLVRARYPEMLLCVATNGLNLVPYLDELAALKVSHVTVTLNAIDPQIGRQIYAWVRHGKKLYPAEVGAAILLEQQLAAIAGLKTRGLVVKVNTIILPGINDQHIPAVAEKMAALKVDIHNCIPYYRNAKAVFHDLPEPSLELTRQVRAAAGQHLPQMKHCARCRADAVGRLGEAPDKNLMLQLQTIARSTVAPQAQAIDSTRSYIAVASREGMLINQHLGETERLHIYRWQNNQAVFVETRSTPALGGPQRWEQLAARLADCRMLLVSGIGSTPRQTLAQNGLDVQVVEGLLADMLPIAFGGQSLKHLLKHEPTVCGASCSGAGGGCQ